MLDDSPPLVSVIVPVFNAGQYIRKCLQSVLRQSYNNLDIIVVDDGSTDTTLKVLREFAHDPRILIITQQNSGPSQARNKGMSAAKGEFICFVDADDYLAPNYVQCLLEPLLHSHRLNMTVANYIEYSLTCPTGVQVSQVEAGRIPAKIFLLQVLEGTMGVLWGKMFRAATIERHALRLYEEIHYQEDLLFVSQYVHVSEEIYGVPQHIYHYNRLNATSITYRLQEDHLHEFEKVQSKLLETVPWSVFQTAVRNRAHLFYQSSILYMAIASPNYYKFKNQINNFDYTRYSSQYRGSLHYILFYKFVKIRCTRWAFYYIKAIVALKRILSVH